MRPRRRWQREIRVNGQRLVVKVLDDVEQLQVTPITELISLTIHWPNLVKPRGTDKATGFSRIIRSLGKMRSFSYGSWEIIQTRL